MQFSKTDVPCDCSYLQDAADDPQKPIEFDARLNEFHIVYSTEHGKGMMSVYHCPFCGGKAPESRRSLMFAKSSSQEEDRLIEMTKHLKTLDSVFLALGSPDEDDERGIVSTKPEKDGKPNETRAYRVLVYERLSETANVHIQVYSPDRVFVSLQGKYIGDKG